MSFDRSEPTGEFVICPVCENKTELQAADESHCRYCQTPIGLDPAELPSLSDIVGLEVVGKVKWLGPGVYYEAVRYRERLLITLLEEGSVLYSNIDRFPERGKADPYRSLALRPHPNLIRPYPVMWQNKVAIAAVDFMDGQRLGDWLHTVAPIDVADAVCIVLKCLNVAKHVGNPGLDERLHPDVIQICTDGKIKITAYAGVLEHVFGLPDRSPMESMDFYTPERPKFRFSSRGCTPPEFDFEMRQAGRYSADQLRVQQIYSLGGLLYELLVDEEIPTISRGQHLVKRFELVPPHELVPRCRPSFRRSSAR